MQVIPQFTEVIKVCQGLFCDLDMHIERVRETVNHFFAKQIDLDSLSTPPVELTTHRVTKCRILYDQTIGELSYSPYLLRRIDKMVVVESDSIEYRFKYADRSCFDQLRPLSVDFDELLIVKNGLVTDTTFSNVVFEDRFGELFTPATPLLNGTKRRKLIQQGVIKERIIYRNDIWKYGKLFLINAMIDLSDDLSLPTSKINVI